MTLPRQATALSVMATTLLVPPKTMKSVTSHFSAPTEVSIHDTARSFRKKQPIDRTPPAYSQTRAPFHDAGTVT